MMTLISTAKMIRSIGLATALGALAGLGAIYAAGPSERQNAVGAGREASDTAEAERAIEDPPICSSTGVLVSEAEWAELDPDFAAGKEALVKGDWMEAIAVLKLAAVRDPRNADILVLYR